LQATDVDVIKRLLQKRIFEAEDAKKKMIARRAEMRTNFDDEDPVK
jgi:hypothetical protein